MVNDLGCTVISYIFLWGVENILGLETYYGTVFCVEETYLTLMSFLYNYNFCMVSTWLFHIILFIELLQAGSKGFSNLRYWSCCFIRSQVAALQILLRCSMYRSQGMFLPFIPHIFTNLLYIDCLDWRGVSKYFWWCKNNVLPCYNLFFSS